MQKKTGNNVRTAIKFLKLSQQNFTVKHSNYTTTIECNGTKQMYCVKKRTNESFAANNLIQKNFKQYNFIEKIKQEPILNNKEIYYKNRDYISPVHYPTVINIDLNNAYPTTLLQQGGIDTYTFNFLNRLKKTEKLASLGMLAARHDKYTYEKGKLINVESSKPKKYSSAFFYCVKWVDFLMLEAEKIAGIDFLYFWVDGIYLNPMTPQPVIDEICQLFNELGYMFSIDIMHNFNLKRTGNNLNITFDEIKNDTKKTKSFIVPDKKLIENHNKIITHYLNKN
jgi:hypothetical protein